MDITKHENKAETVIDDMLPPETAIKEVKKVETIESKAKNKEPQVVEITVVKANNGIKEGVTKKVLLNSVTTKYMITNGYWKVN